MEKRPVVFIDRDGTINKEAGYINHPDNFEVYPFVSHAVRLLNVNDILAVVVTNQAGIARGYYPIGTMHLLHEKMESILNENGAKIDALYYCPHHPSSKIKEYALDCNCRKPKTGMIDKALQELPIDEKNMYVVGDKLSDMEFGWNAGCKTIMVMTGYGKGELVKLKNYEKKPDFICENLLDAVLFVLEDLKK
ncbi:HAD family hydrolase [Deferribacter autotrophicus]|uniref:D,D-heptose 1,7-bisphosphate phosphatase n=1 Tax=Deferribacter autotrophicus TaxID=500465 RepID=A0A5A8F6X8_9BACT|nr:HAD family hydrolase [Deferribacter autotrophicus]KAA0257765.1 HAD family hydrolase [Deferribacter autotrophicus]